jgi:hypothetical protein
MVLMANHFLYPADSILQWANRMGKLATTKTSNHCLALAPTFVLSLGIPVTFLVKQNQSIFSVIQPCSPLSMTELRPVTNWQQLHSYSTDNTAVNLW